MANDTGIFGRILNAIWVDAAEEKPIPRKRNSAFLDSEVYAAASSAFRKENINQLAFQKTAPEASIVDTGVSYAQDSADGCSSLKSAFRTGNSIMPDALAMWYARQGFIGHQMCAIIAQHWLVNKACLIPARDAIRRGFKITSNSGEDVPHKVLDAIGRSNNRFRLNKNLVEFVKMGRVFGIRIAIFNIESDDPDFYVKRFNPDSITPGSYRGISQVDPYWCAPELTSTGAGDPSSISFYEPEYWLIGGKRYHKSHLVIMRGPEVADVLKPSYQYGGLSVPQMIYERVYAAERTSNEVPQLSMTKRLNVFYTNKEEVVANPEKFEETMLRWVQYRDNFGIKVADKEDEKIEQLDTGLADLDALIMSQYQLVAAIANIPANKLLGTTPKGFNVTGEYDADSYFEELESIQANDMAPLVDRHLTCVVRSEICPKFNIPPFDVDCTWEPVDSLTTKELADINKVKADTAKILAVDIGAIDAMEVRAAVAADEKSGYNGLELIAENIDQDDKNVYDE